MTLWRASMVGVIATAGACTLAAGLDELEFPPPQAPGGSGGDGTGATGGETVNGGSGGGTALTFTDDELGGEFGEGTFMGTSFEDGRLALDTPRRPDLR